MVRERGERRKARLEKKAALARDAEAQTPDAPR
jgi:hypothetical protein